MFLTLGPARISVCVGLLLAYAAASAAFAQAPPSSSSRPAPDPRAAEELAPLLKQFVRVLTTVQSEGANPADIDRMIYGGAIPSMLRPLDPHTQFFDPGQFEQLRQMESSEQKGFGSVVSVMPGRVIFLQTLPGTPSAKAGIQPGDELVAIGNVFIQNLNPEQMIDLLTQARQQKISVLIRRQGSTRPLSFTLEPALMDAPSVDRAFLLAPKQGYIRVASWDMQTGRQFREALTKLGGTALEGIVIDLRNNPGGVVAAALEVASLFLEPGQKILSARGRAGEVQSASVPAGVKPLRSKVAVIINGKTASASEIFTGALQDHDRAAIVGEPSYGKGLVQSVMPLSNGAGLAITTAFYYTPSGRSIQKPLRGSALSRSLESAKQEQVTFKTDNGRPVPGGGGIQPDIVVHPPALTRLEEVLSASGALTVFATDYLRNHSPLPEDFNISPEILDEFKVFLSTHNIQPSAGEWSSERKWVTDHLKEELVTQAQGVAKGDEIEAQIDPQIQAALQAVQHLSAR